MKICPMCGASYEDASVFCSVDGAALRSLADGNDLLHTVIADRYLITRKLGEGGMGRVYLAKHVRLPQSWAIKILDPALVRDTGSLARFNQEAANASRIENRHVARVIDFGETADGLLYLAMEYVDGEALSRTIEREGPLDPVRAADIVSQVAEALGAAHELGIVHRDLKPDNIMVGRSRSGKDEAKVVDFGIAKALHDEREKVTKTGFVIGTPEYMSPEQISSGEVDGRSDVYALALVAFRMLTGRLPFPADTPQEAMLRRVTHPPRTLADMHPDPEWPAEVQAVLDRGLAREPDDRFPTAADFANALRAAVDAWRSPAPAPTAPVFVAPAPAEAVNETTTGFATAQVARPTAQSAARPSPPTPSSPPLTTAAPTPTPTPSAARRTPTVVRVAAALGIVAVLGVGGYFAIVGRDANERPGDTRAAGSAAVDAALPAATMGDSTEALATAETTATVLTTGNTEGSTGREPEPATGNPAGTGGEANDAAGNSATPPRPAASERGAPANAASASGAAGTRRAAEDASERARQELDRLEAMIDVLTESNARRLLASIPDALPRLATRTDTVEAWYYALQANILLNDIPAACGVMRRIGGDGKSTPFAAPLQIFSDSLPCR